MDPRGDHTFCCAATSGMLQCDMERPVVIFDFDGAIVDSGPIFTACVNELGREFGYGKLEAGSGLKGMSAHEIFTRRLGLSGERLHDWTERLKSVIRPRMMDASPFKGMKEVLARLAPSFRVGILTSNSGEVVQQIFVSHGFAPVDFVSPEAPILEKEGAIGEAMLRQGLRPDETVYVGDEVRDVRACRTVGIRIVSATRGFNSRRALEAEGPDYLVDSPEELTSVLLHKILDIPI